MTKTGRAKGIVLAILLAAGSGASAAPVLTRADVERAISQFKPVIAHALQDSGLPGLAVGVVFEDEVLWIGTYGVREVGNPAPIDRDSLFQLASISKPIGSTLIARLVGEGRVSWEDRMIDYSPDFKLADDWTSRHVTLADLYSHRSGLPDHAGEELEEFGYTQQQIVERLRLEPLQAFRAGFEYTNYGLTAAAEAAVSVTGKSWEDASRDLLYLPAGMNSTTSRFDQYLASPNRAVPHVRHPDGHWSADFQQDPSRASPAAGVASTISDMTRWLRLQLNGGVIDGVRIVDEKALAQTHAPYTMLAAPATYTARTTHYGLGWFVYSDDFGQMRWAHAGSFALGAATNAAMIPARKLGIVILTNGFPMGIPEALTESFFDLAMTGKESRPWYEQYRDDYARVLYPQVQIDYRRPPADAIPPRRLDRYVGTYSNAFFGDVEVAHEGDHLAMRVGPWRRPFVLGHYSGNTFWYIPPGEFGVVPSPVTFSFDKQRVNLIWGRRQADGSFADDPHGPLVRTLACASEPLDQQNRGSCLPAGAPR